jgi:chorismate mutase
VFLFFKEQGMSSRGIRGATTVEKNEEASILSAIMEL